MFAAAHHSSEVWNKWLQKLIVLRNVVVRFKICKISMSMPKKPSKLPFLFFILCCIFSHMNALVYRPKYLPIYFFKDIVTFSFIWLANCLISGLPKKDEKKLIISLSLLSWFCHQIRLDCHLQSKTNAHHILSIITVAPPHIT